MFELKAMNTEKLIQILDDIIYSDQSNAEFHLAIKDGINFLDELKKGTFILKNNE